MGRAGTRFVSWDCSTARTMIRAMWKRVATILSLLSFGFLVFIICRRLTFEAPIISLPVQIVDPTERFSKYTIVKHDSMTQSTSVRICMASAGTIRIAGG